MGEFRSGIGYDVHRVAEGRRCVLGGVEVPWDFGLDGHSDADVLVHAIIDALLGSVCAGDIGSHFPDTDAEWKDADSRELLRVVRGRVFDRDVERIVHVDATVIAQAPKLGPYIEAMRQNLAEDLKMPMDRVSIKATTHEQIGSLGRGQGVAAMAVATVEWNG